MVALDRNAESIGKSTIAGKVEDRLRAEILHGTLAPGIRLNLDRLREELGVSVSTLREAVTRLVADGLIDAEEQRGYSVAPISLENLAEITRLRMELEPLALGFAIRNGGLDWETEVMASLYRLNRTRRDASDVASLQAWEQAHNAFHRALIDRCDMPLLIRIAKMLQTMNDRYRHIFLQMRSDQRNLEDEHRAIAEAAAARDSDRATGLLRAHLERTGTTLRELLAAHLPEKTS